MFIYFIMFAVAFLWYYASRKNRALVGSPVALALFFTYLAIFIGLADMIGGYDRYIYGALFDGISDTITAKGDLKQILFYIRGKEYGYFLWEVLIAHITANRYVFIFLTTGLMYFLFYKAFKEYMDDYPMACLLFLALFVFFTMTYLRQTIACGIAWQAVKYIWKKKPIPFFSLVLLAASFHNSALVFAPMYFVPIRKFSKRAVIFFLVACLILGISPFASWAMTFAGDAMGTSSRTNEYANDMQGFQIWYVIEAIVFMFIVFRNYSTIKKSPKELTFLNMTIAFCGILVAFMRFGQGGRFGWFYFIGIIYMFSTFVSNAFQERWLKYLIHSLCFVLFLRILSSWAFNLTPYKTFLTNGYPSGEFYIYEENEYDYGYTDNKFYRPIIDIK